MLTKTCHETLEASLNDLLDDALGKLSVATNYEIYPTGYSCMADGDCTMEGNCI